MALVATFNGDVVLIGELLGLLGIDYPPLSITNAHVSGSAAIAASKCQKSLSPAARQSGTVADETIILHVVKGATGTVKHFSASAVTVATGVSSFTVDLQKNGVTMLQAPITVNAATGDLGEEVGTLTVTSLVDGDVLTAVIDATASGTDTPATGAYAQVDLDELYAA